MCVSIKIVKKYLANKQLNNTQGSTNELHNGLWRHPCVYKAERAHIVQTGTGNVIGNASNRDRWAVNDCQIFQSLQ